MNTSLYFIDLLILTLLLFCSLLSFPLGGVTGGAAEGGGAEGGEGQLSSGSPWSSRSEVNPRWLFSHLSLGFKSVAMGLLLPTGSPDSRDVYLGRGVAHFAGEFS